MAETKWTPGPWTVMPLRNGERNRLQIAQDTPPLSRILAALPNWFLDEDFDSEEYIEHEANVRLMAAAPQLYDALEEATDVFVATFAQAANPDDPAGWSDPDHFATYKRLRAALSLARGESAS